jgi:two-component system sensor histidine kinase DctS
MDANGRHFGWMGSMVDITERKRAEEIARQQQERLQATSRLVAVGEMASSIAHELNQPLAAISSYCTAATNLLRNGAGNADVVPALEKAVEQSRRAGQVIRRIYSLSRSSDSRFERVSLADSIDAALSLLEGEIRQRGVRINFQAARRPIIDGDPILIEQILLNLLRNALDAMRTTPMEQRAIEIGLDAGG